MHGRGAVGMVLALCLAVWALFAHPGTAGGVPFAATVGLAVASWLLGAAFGRNAVVLVAAVAAVAAVAVLTGAPESLTGGPAAEPLGYANANAALLSAGVAGLVGMAARSRGNVRRGLIAGGLLLLVVCTATESRAATIACVVMLLLLFVIDDGTERSWQVLAGTVGAATFAVTVLLGATHDAGGRAAVIEDTVGGTRTALWGDALDLANGHPTRGVGPGQFETESVTASEDPDLHHAHSAPLETAAELGWTGAVLLFALAAWVVVALGRDSILFAVLALQPMLDYTLRFPAVAALSAVTLGALSTARPRAPS